MPRGVSVSTYLTRRIPMLPSSMHSGFYALYARDDAITGERETIREMLDPLFLGLVVGYFLWGIQITQTYYYYKSYRKTDRTWLKGAVGLLFMVDVLGGICLTRTCWIFFVEGWGDLNKVTTFPGWGSYAVPLTDAFTASIVHCFYSQKIWTLLDPPYNLICTGLVLALTLIQLTAGIGDSIVMYSTHMTLSEFSQSKIWGCIWLITASLNDIIITALLTWKLSKLRTSFKNTDDIISKIIRLIFETGLATAIVQILDIIFYLVWPLKPYHIGFAVIAPKIYSNSMLALVNSRQPRNTTEMVWDPRQHHSADSIHIHTSQTVSVTNDYDLNDKIKTKWNKARSANDKLTAPDVERYSSFPFAANNPAFAVT